MTKTKTTATRPFQRASAQRTTSKGPGKTTTRARRQPKARGAARRWQGPYPTELKADALQRLRRGEDVSAVAEELGLRVATLRGWAAELQIPLWVRGGAAGLAVYERYRLRHQQLCELLLSNDDLSAAELAERSGLSENSVRAIAARYGIPALRQRIARMRGSRTSRPTGRADSYALHHS